jgi:hypothetical protein
MSKKIMFEDEIVSHIIEQEKQIQKQREEITKMEKELADLRRLTGLSNEVHQCAVTGYKFLYRLKTPATYECIPVEDEEMKWGPKRQTCADISDSIEMLYSDDENDNDICDKIMEDAYERCLREI